MFLPPDQRPVPPPWQPPAPRPGSNAGAVLVVAIALAALLGPIAGGSLIGMASALAKAW